MIPKATYESPHSPRFNASLTTLLASMVQQAETTTLQFYLQNDADEAWAFHTYTPATLLLLYHRMVRK